MALQDQEKAIKDAQELREAEQTLLEKVQDHQNKAAALLDQIAESRHARSQIFPRLVEISFTLTETGVSVALRGAILEALEKKGFEPSVVIEDLLADLDLALVVDLDSDATAFPVGIAIEGEDDKTYYNLSPSQDLRDKVQAFKKE